MFTSMFSAIRCEFENRVKVFFNIILQYKISILVTHILINPDHFYRRCARSESKFCQTNFNPGLTSGKTPLGFLIYFILNINADEMLSKHTGMCFVGFGINSSIYM